MNTSNESSVYYIGTGEILGITSTSINLVLGVPINSYVLWMISTGVAGPMASEIFALNLSVCEIIFCLFSLTITITNMQPFRLVCFTLGLLSTGASHLPELYLCREIHGSGSPSAFPQVQTPQVQGGLLCAGLVAHHWVVGNIHAVG